MSGRNPTGARLPSREQQGPRLLPDGSESQHHGGSFHAYMAHKINKLDEQFLDHASGAKQTQLFKGVAIHVNGFTVPTHHELRQLMAVHGGTFQNYFARDVVTHIVCSNLPDAKVKEYEKARQPPAIVRPEWVVNSIRAGRLLPTQDYALQQLRDAPGQRKLKAFQKVELQALPATAIYGGQAAAVVGSAAANEQSVGQSAAAAAGLEGATAASGSPLDALGGPVPRPAFVDAAQRKEGEGGAAEGPAAPALPLSMRPAEAAASNPAPPPPAPLPAAPAQAPPMSPGPPAARPRSPGAGPALAAAAAAGGYDPQELRQALALAAKLRSECDGLKGPPKSSRDDPDFVRNFHKYSRLHFIGSWRARIEALMASAAGSQGPAPQRPSAAHPRTVIHLDMDCFFASVSEVAHPVLRGKPVAVSHSASASGTGEVSTCNYEARKYGVRSGMWISQAKELCPALVVVPYMFAEYEAVSEKVYRTLLRRTSCVEALSCDEAYLDVTGLGDPEQLAAEIRAEIQSTTGCTASAGIGPNPLMARIASERAKPNGQLRIHGGPQALEFLQGLAADALPGVGWATRQQLKGHGIATVADLQGSSKAFLQGLLGQKQGAMLWDFAHGRDNRSVEPIKTRKSVGAEVNYGLRFSTQDDAWKVLDDLAGEVQERLRRAGVKGRTVTLKLKRKKPGAVEPAKFLGHGECDSFSKSTSLVRFTDIAADIARESRGLLLSFQVPPAEIRGLGIQVTKLDNDGSAARPGGAASSKLAAFLQLGQQQAVQRQGEPQEVEEQQQQQQQQQHAEAEQQTELERQQVANTALQPQERARPAIDAVAQLPQPQPTALPTLQPPEQQHQQPLEQHDEDRTITVQGMGAARQPHSAPSKLSPAKQVPLKASLARAAAASQDGPREHLGVGQRQELLQQWQGVSLSQMDAAALESLPYEVQRELVGAGGGPVQQKPPWQRDSQPLHGQAGAQQQHAEEMAAEREGKARGKRPLLAPEAGSDEEGPARGADDDDDSELPAPRATGVAPQQQPAGAGRGDMAAGSSRAAAQPASPIVALPAFSQVDPAVLEALPLSMRRELEVAYGIGKHAPGLPVHAQRAGRGGSGMPRHVSKRQRLDAFVANPPPYGVSARGQAAAARHVQQRGQHEAVQLSLSQLDPTVLQELPPEVRQEVLQQLQQQQQQPGGDGRHRQQQRRSRLGQQRDEEQAWQWRWREEQALREAEEAAAVGGALPASGAGWEAAGQPQVEHSQQQAGQEGGAPPVPVAVELFLQQAEQAGSAQSLAAALSDCLQQLEGQLVAGGAASSPAQHPGQPSPEMCAGQGNGSVGGGHSSSLADKQTDKSSKGSGAGKASGDPGLPPTQPVGQAGADPQPGSSEHQAPALSPRQDSMQRIRGQQQGGAPDAALPPPASPEAASRKRPGANGNSSTDGSQLEPALKELGRCLQQAAAELLAARDLEQLRTLLRAVLKLGGDHPWFEAGAGQAAVAAAQRAVQARYGWPLRLSGLLNAPHTGNSV